MTQNRVYEEVHDLPAIPTCKSVEATSQDLAYENDAYETIPEKSEQA